MPEGDYYIVRGAKMHCEFGSHDRKINLPVSHGSYVNDKPMMNMKDNKPVENIAYFGVCTSGNCTNSENVDLVKEDGQTVSGIKCCPVILAEWLNAKEDTVVDGYGALTTKSQLICACKGKITFVTNGQEEE